MKTVFNTVGNIIGVLIIIGAGIVLALTLKGANPADEQPTTFQSPIEKAVPAPTATISSPQRISPVATPTLAPMSAKATVVALGSQYKSEVASRPLTPIKSSQDVISAVLNDPLFKMSVDDSAFGSHIKNATPGEPIFVTSLNPKKNDYYLVPFYKNKKISGIAVVGIENGAGILGMWTNASYDKFPVVDSKEARKLIEAQGFKVTGKPRLVFKWIREGGDETSPFWEVRTEKGVTFYIVYILGDIKIYRADEVHPIGGSGE